MTTPMQKLLLALLLVCLFSAADAQAQNPKMKRIFNGKNLRGWVQPENNTWWTVADKELHVKSGPNRKGSILWTEQPYRNFVVQCEFKMGEGVVDSGVFLREERMQVQIGISGSLKRDMTGSPYVPGKGYPVEAAGVADLLDLEGWNTLKAQAIGNTYTVWLNGKEVMTYTLEGAIAEGPIGLQLHPNNEMSIAYRNIRAAKLGN
jgi:hypothetical protein